LSFINRSAQEQGHALSAIPAAAMVRSLISMDYLPEMVVHCLRLFGHPLEGQEATDTWHLDEHKV